ncbi:acyl-CoA dehydrogenase family protein [Chitinibacteraceae bacterium HSL-7]
MIPVQYLEALAIEQALGDPALNGNTLSWASAIAHDETDAFPEAAVSLLTNLGIPRLYVPEPLGGLFTSCESFIAMGRVLARRNMSVAVSFSTMLWSMLAWIGGSPAQQRRVADWVMKHGQFPCLAYSEASHGADLSANELTATRNEDGSYTLNGEKWPINRATRSGFLVLLARTDSGQHLRNHTLFIIDKHALDSRHYYHLPRVKTHGLRGCDISGIGFRQCRVPADAVIGREGHGLELALKGFQVTRTFCSALSLGVGDSALRLVADFAASRTLYGAAVATLPHTRDVLANAYVSQLMSECVSVIAARGLHLFPSQFAAWSSIAKVQVSHATDFATQQLAGVLGARYYMREQHGEGMFQKFLRDGAIVSVFDGSSIVCLDSLATLLPSMVRNRRQLGPTTAADWAALYDLRAPLPSLPFQSFDLMGRGRDAVLESLPSLSARLCALRPDDRLDVATLARLADATRLIELQLDALDHEVMAEPVRRGERNSARQFSLAERLCHLHAATAALGFWLFNRDHLGAFHASGHWLLAILERAGHAHFESGQLDDTLAQKLMQHLEHQRTEHLMFSLLNWPLATPHLAESLPEEQMEPCHDHHAA